MKCNNSTQDDDEIQTNSSSSKSLNQKRNIIHEKLMLIIEKKIQHYIGLDDYDLDYINYDCNEKDQLHFMKVYNEVVQCLKEMAPDEFQQGIIKRGSFYKVDKWTKNNPVANPTENSPVMSQ